jgi:hypothetical protein
LSIFYNYLIQCYSDSAALPLLSNNLFIRKQDIAIIIDIFMRNPS